MIDIKAHFDREKDISGSVIIHAKSDVPELCSDIEHIVASIIKGLAMQLPESQDACCTAAALFAIAATEGAKRGFNAYKEEAGL